MKVDIAHKTQNEITLKMLYFPMKLIQLIVFEFHATERQQLTSN